MQIESAQAAICPLRCVNKHRFGSGEEAPQCSGRITVL